MKSQLTDDQIDHKIYDSFYDKTGLIALAIGHKFPVSLDITILTKDRTFAGKLTQDGLPIKQSFQEYI